MGNPFICQFVSAATIVMAGCTSIPNNPVVLDENADGSSELNVLVDERPTENRVSGHVSKSRYRAFRYGDEHFVPAPIYILDKSLLMKLGSALPNEKIKIEKFVLQEVQPINKDGAIGVAGVSYGVAILLEGVGVPWGKDYLTCTILGSLEEKTFYASAKRYDEKDITFELRELAKECIDLFVKEVVVYVNKNSVVNESDSGIK